MSIKAVQKVAEVERDSAKRREAAEQAAKSKVMEAEKQAAALLEATREETETAVRQMLAVSEGLAAEYGEGLRRETQALCQQLAQDARGRLDQAAELIMKRVVDT